MALIDLLQTNPEGWEKDVSPLMVDITDIEVYETHIRDYTMSSHSGVESKCQFPGINDLKRCLLGYPEWSGEPMLHISYVTCHDDYYHRDWIDGRGDDFLAEKIE